MRLSLFLGHVPASDEYASVALERRRRRLPDGDRPRKKGVSPRRRSVGDLVVCRVCWMCLVCLVALRVSALTVCGETSLRYRES